MAEVNLEAFMKATNKLERTVDNLKKANESSGKEIAGIIGEDLKKVTDPFVAAFEQIPGMQTLGKIGANLFSKTKARLEERALAKRIGLTDKEFQTAKENKKINDILKEEAEQLNQATQNLLGFDAQEIMNAVRGRDEKGKFSKSIPTLLKEQSKENQKQIDAFKNFSTRKTGADEEKENREVRREEEIQSTLSKIASGFDGMSFGGKGGGGGLGLFDILGAGALGSELKGLSDRRQRGNLFKSIVHSCVYWWTSSRYSKSSI